MSHENQQDYLTSLDLGSSFIRLAVAKPQTQDKTTHILGYTEIESRGIKKGDVIHFDALVSAIQEAIDDIERQTGITVDSAQVVVGNSQLLSDNVTETIAIRNQEIRLSDVERLNYLSHNTEAPAGFEAIHTLSGQYIINGKEGIINPVGLCGSQMACVYHRIMSPQSDLKNIVRACNSAGIHVESFVAEPIAAALSALHPDDLELGSICISLGSHLTHVCVFSNGHPIFTKSYAFGAHHITKDLAVGLRTTQVVAEKIKKNFGSTAELINEKYINLELFEPSNQLNSKDVQQIIKPRVIEILNTIYLELQSLNLISLATKGVILTGGGALLTGLISTTEEQFKLPSRIGFPREITGLIDGVRTPISTAALGIFHPLLSPQEKPNGFRKRAGASREDKTFKTMASNLWQKIVEPFQM